MGFQDFGDFGHPRHPAIRTTGLLTFALAGLSPAEHTSLHWSPPSDMLAVRNRAIDGRGLSPPRSTALLAAPRLSPAGMATRLAAPLIDFLSRSKSLNSRPPVPQKEISDHFYFRNVSNNSGIFDSLVSEDQEFKEAALAYFFLLMAGAPLTANSPI